MTSTIQQQPSPTELFAHALRYENRADPYPAYEQLLPDEPNVNDTLGWIYYRKNMAAQAVGYLETAARRAPGEPVHQYHLGMAYVQTGDWTKARDALKRAFALKPDFDGASDAKKALGMIGA